MLAIALALARVQGLERHIRAYLNGRDFVAATARQLVIDFYG